MGLQHFPNIINAFETPSTETPLAVPLAFLKKRSVSVSKSLVSLLSFPISVSGENLSNISCNVILPLAIVQPPVPPI